MYAQLFLGLYMLIQGVSHLFNLKYFISNKEKTKIGSENLASYRKSLAIAYFWLGLLYYFYGIGGKLLYSFDSYLFNDLSYLEYSAAGQD